MSPTNSIQSPFHAFKQIAVIGAAGKMGSGISLLLLEEMAACHFIQKIQKEENGKSASHMRLFLIDSSHNRLDGLRQYLESQLLRWAEKKIVFLRDAVKHIDSLISNREIIDYFILEAFKIVYFSSSLEEAKNTELIFEAIVEDIETKILTLGRLKKISSVCPYFFSNTSSIPIFTINSQASLDNKIIGFHFYNPPAVQKLIEIIPLEDGNQSLKSLAISIAAQLNKKVIFSKDVAGFIGNGYFLREIIFSCALVETLSSQHGTLQAVYMVNKVSQDFLLRPMGIFQLIDYVGLDVVVKIGTIMNHYLQLPLNYTALFFPLLEAGKIGGQHPDGSQKDGFFSYVGNKIIEIFSESEKHYGPIEATDWKKTCDEWLGKHPRDLTWKTLSKDPQKIEAIRSYFAQLQGVETPGAQLAIDFLKNLQKIALNLVNDGVVESLKDVDAVLKEGFYHLYGISEIELKSNHHKGLYATI
ncbi:MAG: 3-hydroxyacyl-CoA dehydrogenase family protein [Parachlamydiaceae bacterium]|nr:3-hydroxyacyl-CoA dehydrogenase family protein [Parachlamydiaceae bacterium]